MGKLMVAVVMAKLMQTMEVQSTAEKVLYNKKRKLNLHGVFVIKKKKKYS